MLALISCDSEHTSTHSHSNEGKIIKCNPTIIRCDTLPQPEPIPMEFDDLERHELELGISGEPFIKEFKFGSGKVSPLIKENITPKRVGDGTTQDYTSNLS